MDANPDGVLVSLYGGNLVDFIRQGTEMGFFAKISCVICNLAYSADVMLGLSLDMPKGGICAGLYWFRGNDTPVNSDFVKEYRARYRVFPDFNAEGALCGRGGLCEGCRGCWVYRQASHHQSLGGVDCGHSRRKGPSYAQKTIKQFLIVFGA